MKKLYQKLDEEKILDVICATWDIPLGSNLYIEFYENLRKLAKNLRRTYDKGKLFVL